MEEAKDKIKVADIIGSLVAFIVLAGLLGIIVWQQLTISDLRVEVVEAGYKASEETRDLMIDKYWAEDKSEALMLKGSILLDTNRALLETYEEGK